MSIVKIRAALESGLAAMPALIPASPIATFNNGLFTTSAPHLLLTGLNVTISGCGVGIDGSYAIVVVSPTTFTLQNLTTKAPFVSAATGVGGVVTANLIAWEGVTFPTVPNAPYISVRMLPARPENPTFGGAHSREIGLLQLTLYYPTQRGTNAIMTRAELIRSTFPRGASFSNGGVVVNIPHKPELYPAMVGEEIITCIIRIPYWADLFS